MKKLIVSLLAASLIFSCCACGGETSGITNSTEKTSSSIKAEETTTGSVQEEKIGPIIHDEARIDKTPTIEETTLVDEDGVKIVATSIEYSSYSVDIAIRIENSTDSDLSVYSDTMSAGPNYVNDFSIYDGYLSCDVAAGKTAEDVMSFGNSELLIHGIDQIAKFELSFYIDQDLTTAIENSDFDALAESEERYYFNCELDTSVIDSFVFDPDAYSKAIQQRGDLEGYEVVYFSNEPAFTYDSFDVLSQCIVKSEDEYIAFIEVHNKYQEPVLVSSNDIYLNGLGVCGGCWSSEKLAAGKYGVLSINLSSVMKNRFQEAYGVNDFKTLSLSVDVEDADYNLLIEDVEVTVNLDNSADVDTSGEELYNSDGIRVIDKGLAGPSSEYDSGFYWLLEIENTSDKEIYISVDDYQNELTINDISTDGYGDCESKGHDIIALIVNLPYAKDDMNLNSTDDITSIVACIELEYEEDTNTITLNYNK